MKIPLEPPSRNSFIEKLIKEGDLEKISLFFSSSFGPYDSKGRYSHWDKVRHLAPPEGLSSEFYWHAIKTARTQIAQSLPFKDKSGRPITFSIPDMVMRDILWISENATGAIAADPKISDQKTKQTFIINSLIEESISSSQLEGASTTRRVAKEMIRTGRSPVNTSEKMIVNNYRAMKFVKEYVHDELTESMIFQLHRILTEGTLKGEDANKAGVYRGDNDDIGVYSNDDVLLHRPPVASELPKRLKLVCDFVNDKSDDNKTYIPPVIKAIIVHFMIGYDHPFVDGNGRTARVLFYWLMAKEGYWLMEYLSISRVLKKAPSQYVHAYLHTETDQNDTTYFIIHQLDVIKAAIEELHVYLASKTDQLKKAQLALAGSALKGKLNYRQIEVLKNAIKNPGAEYTIKSHQTSHGVAYQTSRTDLLALADEFGLLKKSKLGLKDIFVAPRNLRDLIREYG